MASKKMLKFPDGIKVKDVIEQLQQLDPESRMYAGEIFNYASIKGIYVINPGKNFEHDPECNAIFPTAKADHDDVVFIISNS